jgi:hypothetical protein
MQVIVSDHLMRGNAALPRSTAAPRAAVVRDQVDRDDALPALGALRHPAELDQAWLFEAQVPAVMGPGAALVLHRQEKQAVDPRIDDLPSGAEPALHARRPVGWE